MRAWFVALLLTLSVAGQSRLVITGRATQITGDQITVVTGPGASTLLFADKDSQIWRGKTGNSLSVIQPGDEVVIAYRRDGKGRPVIIELTANIDHISGRITKVGSGEFEVDQNYNADPQSAYVRQFRQIAFDKDTDFQDSAPEDLRIGRDVDVFGLKTIESRVEASRVIVYDGNRPVRMPRVARIISPNGQIQNPK
jgi:hypothetical protein